MSNRREKMAALLAQDTRYDWEAYQFIEECLQRTQERLGRVVPEGGQPAEKHHITAKELCEGVGEMAADRYGPLAGHVLAQMGLSVSDNVGDIVWNLVESGLLMKSERDRKEDFSSLVDYRTAFRNLEITLPEAQQTAADDVGA